MLGTNDVKERLGMNASCIGIGMERLGRKAQSVDCWGEKKPNIYRCYFTASTSSGTRRARSSASRAWPCLVRCIPSTRLNSHSAAFR